MQKRTKEWIIGLLVFALLTGIVGAVLIITRHRIDPPPSSEALVHTGILKEYDADMLIDHDFTDAYVHRIDLVFEDGRKCALEHIYSENHPGWDAEVALRDLVGKEITVRIIEKSSTVLSLTAEDNTVVDYAWVCQRLVSRRMTYLIIAITFFTLTALFLGCAIFLYLKYRPKKW